MRKRLWIFLSVLAVLLIASFILLWTLTGFLQAGRIDEKDLSHWDYVDGVISGADSFEIIGTSDTCWIMLHSYESTPLEMRELSERINDEFGDSVFAVLLQGHGEVPSKLNGLTLDDWYVQVDGVFNNVSNSCENVNLVGSSFGGALSIRLAENYEIKNLFVIDAYLFPTYRWYMIFSTNVYLDFLSPISHYSKKSKLVQVNDPAGLDDYVAYWSFVLAPVKDSKKFLRETYNNLFLIEENILIQHSTGDAVAEPGVAQDIFERVSSNTKEIVLFEDSNHIILADYDSKEAINNIIDFEKNNR